MHKDQWLSNQVPQGFLKATMAATGNQITFPDFFFIYIKLKTSLNLKVCTKQLREGKKVVLLFSELTLVSWNSHRSTLMVPPGPVKSLL